MTVEYRVISIGTLSRNRLWGEAAAVRTAHATTTLVTDGDRAILVDPSLPAPALRARFNERTGRSLRGITDVFCTTLRPVHRRSVEALPHARWWAHETELRAYRTHLESLSEATERLGAEEARQVAADLALVRRFRPAPEKFAPQVDLYPLAGASVGSAGLLLTPATLTILIAGDAAITRAHILAGQVWEGSADAEAALESLREVLEIAEVVIPGHDNVVLAPRRWL
jgi:glyoxylase-like metal-dependent hydrolase (beta-lactamase superfamily II)